MKKLFNSFRYALCGIRDTFKTEQNFRIEIFCTAAVCGLGLICPVSNTEWLLLLLNTGIVLSAELFNTAIERLCDHAEKEIHPAVRIIKDASAAAVLVTAITAAVSAAIIFIPYLIHYIKTLS